MSKDPISIVQRGNLQNLEKTLRKQWRLGQNICLCWCWDERGLLVIFVPHYFLGNYCASREDAEVMQENEDYIRELISGRRRMSRDELFAVAVRLAVSPTFIKLSHPLEESLAVMEAVEQIIRRYGLSFVERRGVLLIDITDFSLYSPFEQASQLNSLSYSMNSAYNKLASRGVEVHFARTTTGDGYYVWNRDTHPRSDQQLFLFLLLILADNAMARAVSKGNTVPVIRAAFHVGSHYELYQAEGVNPTVFSYIVGDVTIELARIVDRALPGQLMLGDFAGAGEGHGSADFLRSCAEAADALKGLSMMGQPLRDLRCWLSRDTGEGEDSLPLDLTITDKHGIKHHAFNLQAELDFDEGSLSLGITPEEFRSGDAARTKGGRSKSGAWWV
ncbi:MAG: hypothetical protein V2I82_14205 [Halieaceae bacterium]|nr:hypothetical protein [Halieaceae bacterium]